MIIRRATLADAEVLLTLRNLPESVQWSGSKVDSETHSQWITRVVIDPMHCLLVGVAGNRVIGYARYQEGEHLTAIVSIAVAPTEQGKGYGQQLLTALAQEARSRGIQDLIAQVAPDNLASARVFLKAGYHFQRALA